MSDTLKGIILDIDVNGIATISVKVNLDEYIKKGFKEVWVLPIDSRKISDKQRRACWALIGEIAEYCGQDKQGMNYDLKFDFLKWRAEQLGDNLETFFSLSSAPMDLVVEYQKYLVNFILRHDVPTMFPLLEFIEQGMYEEYIYACLLHKKCCICGEHTDLHHVDRLGMGANREEVLHEGLEALPLCRRHHTEVHTIGDTEFNKLYHLTGGVPLDKSLCKLYKLNNSKQNTKEGTLC